MNNFDLIAGNPPYQTTTFMTLLLVLVLFF